MKNSMKTLLRTVSAIGALLILSACGNFMDGRGQKQVGSVVDYLYPGAKEAPRMQAGVTYLRPPVRVGLAFAPGANRTAGIGEIEKLALLERVKSSFAQHDFIASIEVIPTSYLRPGGGFVNLNQVAKMFNVEVVALVSYDQVQFTESNMLSVPVRHPDPGRRLGVRCAQPEAAVPRAGHESGQGQRQRHRPRRQRPRGSQ